MIVFFRFHVKNINRIHCNELRRISSNFYIQSSKIRLYAENERSTSLDTIGAYLNAFISFGNKIPPKYKKFLQMFSAHRFSHTHFQTFR